MMTTEATTAVVEALLRRKKRQSARPPPPRRPSSPPPDYLAPFLPPSQSATASLPLSASLLFSPSPSHLLTSSYLQQRQRHYSAPAWASLLSSLSTSSTLYIGNLSFTTREETVYDVFSQCGRIQALYMGLNAQSHVPCGFCFIRFAHEAAARRAKWMIGGMRVDGRVCGVDFDQAFREGRQWGRGKTGGQIRDDHRSSYDEGRGGWGTRERLKQMAQSMQDSQVSEFKSIKGAEEEGKAAEEEVASAPAVKREGRTYADANARRKAATFAALTQSTAVKQEEGREDEREEEPARKRVKVEGETADVGDAEMADQVGEEYHAADVYRREDEEGRENGWTDDFERRDEDSASHEGSGREGEAGQAEEEDEEVEHGFAAVDEDTADPTWS